MTLLAQVIVLPFVLLTTLVWLIVGPLFWLPLLAKTTTIYMVSVLSQAVMGRQRAPSASALQRAITYYFNGFVIILRTLKMEPPAEEEETSTPSFNIFELIFSLVRFVFTTLEMVVMAAIFWGGLLLILQHLDIIDLPWITSLERWFLRLFQQTWSTLVGPRR
jgi:hypothetical protein